MQRFIGGAVGADEHKRPAKNAAVPWSMAAFFMGVAELGGDGGRAEGIEPARVVPQLHRALQGGRVKTLLKINDAVFDDVIAHLLPPGNEQEQAAFLYARASRSPTQFVFEVIESEKLWPSDFLVQD